MDPRGRRGRAILVRDRTRAMRRYSTCRADAGERLAAGAARAASAQAGIASAGA